MANFGDDAVEAAEERKIVSEDWKDFAPKRVDYEDAVGKETNKAIWEKIYRNVGMATAGEKERKSVRMGVYAYCAINGTSREGDYTGDIVLSNGRTISASVIPLAASKTRIRKFLRANMHEAYYALKQSRVMEEEPRFIAKCQAYGISPECAFATADWFSDCPYFSPSEAKAHDIMFVRGIERAKRARNGKTLEAVEAGRVDDVMRAQGPAYDNGNVVDF